MKCHYKLIGEGGIPLVILHGLLGSLDNWMSVAKEISVSRQVILIDARNHGRSPHSEDTGYTAMSADLLELLDDLHIDKVNLLGHSMGGKTAMLFALQNPDRVQSLLVADIAPRLYRGGHEAIFKAMLGTPLTTLYSRTEVEDHLREAIPADGVRLFIMKNLSRGEDGAFTWKANVTSLWAHYEELMGFSPVKQGAVFIGPALFVRGQLSDYITAADEVLIRQYFPAAQIVTIPNAGHWLHADQPELFLSVLKQFLS